jgi:hypothetical protein
MKKSDNYLDNYRGEGFFYLGVHFIAFDHQVEKLMTQGIQQERGFQITQAFLPAIEAVFAHME